MLSTSFGDQLSQLRQMGGPRGTGCSVFHRDSAPPCPPPRRTSALFHLLAQSKPREGTVPGRKVGLWAVHHPRPRWLLALLHGRHLQPEALSLPRGLLPSPGLGRAPLAAGSAAILQTDFSPGKRGHSREAAPWSLPPREARQRIEGAFSVEVSLEKWKEKDSHFLYLLKSFSKDSGGQGPGWGGGGALAWKQPPRSSRPSRNAEPSRCPDLS